MIETVNDFLTESLIDSYEDLIKINESIDYAEIKGLSMQAANESAEDINAFNEGMIDKSKALIKALIVKIKNKINQFSAFVNKSITILLAKMTKGVSKLPGNLKNNFLLLNVIYFKKPDTNETIVKKIYSDAIEAIADMKTLKFNSAKEKLEELKKPFELEKQKIQDFMIRGVEAYGQAALRISSDVKSGVDIVTKEVLSKYGDDPKKAKTAAVLINHIGSLSNQILAAASSKLRKAMTRIFLIINLVVYKIQNSSIK